MTTMIEPTVTNTVAYSPAMFLAEIQEIDGVRHFIEYRSIRVIPGRGDHRSVVEFLEENPHTLVYEAGYDDERMAGYKGVARLYRLED
ncbi:hypothetical protein [Nocardia sp. NPDC059239]|uniref:hypothetical protein n=1 Tax=unclassified Nocardia TaxID=2637762 RepID=UPI0036D16256